MKRDGMKTLVLLGFFLFFVFVITAPVFAQPPAPKVPPGQMKMPEMPKLPDTQMPQAPGTQMPEMKKPGSPAELSSGMKGLEQRVKALEDRVRALESKVK